MSEAEARAPNPHLMTLRRDIFGFACSPGSFFSIRVM